MTRASSVSQVWLSFLPYLEPWVVDRDNLKRHSSGRGGLRRARADRAEVRLRSQREFFERVARKGPTDLRQGSVKRDGVVAVVGEARVAWRNLEETSQLSWDWASRSFPPTTHRRFVETGCVKYVTGFISAERRKH